ncbi:MAG: NAD(P)H-dependent oxidoreductase subunit E [Candidatus Omnitrophota bacterium]
MAEKKQNNKKVGSAVIVGGGVSGMQAALDLADSGIKVYLVEKNSAIGGRMTQLDKTFPTNECAMCVVSPKLVECARHLNIEIISNSDIDQIEGEAGNFNVTLRKRPRFINEDKCTGCGSCIVNCPVRNKICIIPEEEWGEIKLSPEVEVEVKRIIKENIDKKGALMLILQDIDATYNYFSEDVLRYVSRELEVPLGNILRIATFYNAFSLQPRGKHTISVCMGTTCYVKGSEKLLEQLSENLNIGIEETTKDLRFTLKSVRCLGCCSIAPAVMVDDKVYGHVKLGEIEKILKDYK